MESVVVTDTPSRTVTIRLASDDLVVTETLYVAGERGPDLHVHHLHADCFYILKGTITLSLADGDHTLGAGSFVLVPPDVVHTFRNDGPGELRFYNLHAPGVGFDRYLQGLYDPDEAVRKKLGATFDQHPPPEGGGRDPSLVIKGAGDFVAERPSLEITLLADAKELGISSSRGAAGGPSPPPHLHPRHAESFCVLEGKMSFSLNGSELLAEPGSWVHVASGVTHTFSFPGLGAVHFLAVHTPSCGWGDYIRALHSARNEDELAAARAAFDQEPAA